MCGRYVSPERAEMERYWELTDAQIRNPLAQAFNVAPTTYVPMLRRTENRSHEVVAARWGLIPFWWKEAKPPPFTFNARSEEGATKPMWRIPASKARCLVPAMGWYEWKEVERVDPNTGEVKKARQPYFIRLPDRGMIAFAGMMSKRNGEEGKAEYSCTILTRDAVGPVADVHTRMPIALAKDTHRAWLDPDLTDAAVAIEFAREQASSEFIYHAVNQRVNSSRSEGAALIEPFENPA